MFNKLILLTLGLMIGSQVHALKFQQPKSKEIQFRIKGQHRRALVFNSSGSKGQKRPAVLVLHGGGGSAEKATQQTKFDELSVQKGFIAVFAEGTQFRRGMHAWNTGYLLRKQVQRADDIAYFDRLIDTLVKEHGADPQRIYMSGCSNGSMMTFVYSVQRAKKLAAVAPIAGAMFSFEQRPEVPLPILMINGSKDEEVPIKGGYSKNFIVRRNQDAPYKSQEETTRFWVQANNSANRPEQTRKGSVVTSTYPSTPNGAPTISIVDYQGGHGWPGYKAARPGATPPIQSFGAAAIAWDFFQNHSRAGISQNPKPNGLPKPGHQPKPGISSQPKPGIEKPNSGSQPKPGIENQPPVVVITRDQLGSIRESMFGGSSSHPQNPNPQGSPTPISKPYQPLGKPSKPNILEGYRRPSKSCRVGQYGDIPTQAGTYKNLWVCSSMYRNKPLKRSYDLIIPKGNRRRNSGLILALHGGGGSPKSMAAKSQFHAYGDKYGFVTVYPAGYQKKWNSGHAGTEAARAQVDDVHFISTLIDMLVRNLNLDKNQVFVSGHSNGAMMAHRLGAELSAKIAGIAPVAGTVGGYANVKDRSSYYHIPRASEKLQVFAIHGKCDTSVTYDGSRGPTTNTMRKDIATMDGIKFWAETNGCARSSTHHHNGDHNLPFVNYSYGCGGRKGKRASVKLLTINDSGHQWPNGSSKVPKIKRKNRGKAAEAIEWGKPRGCSLREMAGVSQRVNAAEMIVKEFFKR